MKSYLLHYILLLCICFGCKKERTQKSDTPKVAKSILNSSSSKTSNQNIPVFDSAYIAYSFDFPVGKPDANGYYNAQKFRENNHLGEDWNAVTGGNTDLGDPIYAIANGYVKYAKDYSAGWGNVIRVLHKMPNGKMIESLYAHCDKMLVREGVWVRKGEKIGTIGNVHGQYLAHLHFEMREDISLPIGGGYSANTQGYLYPTAFINNHR